MHIPLSSVLRNTFLLLRDVGQFWKAPPLIEGKILKCESETLYLTKHKKHDLIVSLTPPVPELCNEEKPVTLKDGSES